MPEDALDLFSSQISVVTCLLWSCPLNLDKNCYFQSDYTESGFLSGISGIPVWDFWDSCLGAALSELAQVRGACWDDYPDLLVQFGHRALRGFLQLQELGLLIQLLLELVDLCFQLLQPFPAPFTQPGEKPQQILSSFRDTS